MKSACLVSVLLLVFFAWIPPSDARDGGRTGTMHLMPAKDWSARVPDRKLGKLRGGFVGVQWSLEFVATVTNNGGDISSTIPGASGSLPAGSTASVDNGNLQVSTLVALGTGGSFNGIGVVNVIPGNFNVVDFQLNLTVNIVNITNAANTPNLSAYLGR